MKTSHARFAVVALIGLAAPFWWTGLVSQLIYGFFVVAGAVEAPSALFAWTSIFLPSVVLGLIAGLVIGFLSSRPFVGWLIFMSGLMIGSAMLSPLTILVELVASPGTWAFVFSVLAGSVLSLTTNNSSKTKQFCG